jgi:hypothetical protein
MNIKHVGNKHYEIKTDRGGYMANLCRDGSYDVGSLSSAVDSGQPCDDDLQEIATAVAEFAKCAQL